MQVIFKGGNVLHNIFELLRTSLGGLPSLLNYMWTNLLFKYIIHKLYNQLIHLFEWSKAWKLQLSEIYNSVLNKAAVLDNEIHF